MKYIFGIATAFIVVGLAAFSLSHSSLDSSNVAPPSGTKVTPSPATDSVPVPAPMPVGATTAKGTLSGQHDMTDTAKLARDEQRGKDYAVVLASIWKFAETYGSYAMTLKELESENKKISAQYSIPRDPLTGEFYGYTASSKGFVFCVVYEMANKYCYNGKSIEKFRDSVRLADVTAIQLSLELVYDQGYPDTTASLTQKSEPTHPIRLIDPFSKNPYQYHSVDGGKDYEVCAVFELYGKVCNTANQNGTDKFAKDI